MDDTDIYNKKINEIITTGSNSEQLNFLKVYPIYKQKDRIFDKWLDIYISIMKSISVFNNEELQTKKIIVINFLTLALSHDLINYKSSEIFELLNTMQNLSENETCINLIKTNVIKGRSNTDIKRMSSVLNLYMENRNNSTRHIRDFSPKEIAMELTLCSMQLIKNMNWHELLYIAINDKVSPNNKKMVSVAALIEHFHRLSYMVPTIIIEDTDNATRIKTIKHILKICDELKHLHNYNSLFALVAGLSNISIQRIKTI